MPYVKLWIHLIWSTKYRRKLISRELKPLLLDHIIVNAKTKSIYIDTVNCVDDHIHVLVSLSTDQSVAKVTQMIKGESSFWVNHNHLIKSKFEWQDEYCALTISYSHVDRVRQYIRNQEEHHRVKTFSEEFAQFENEYGFKKINDSAKAD